MARKATRQVTKDAHPFWAPAHNYAERMTAIDVARKEARHEAQHMREVLAFARKHHIKGPEAQRFLARQRAAWRRAQVRRQAEAAQAQEWPHQVLCCGKWQVIPSIPYRLSCCGRVLVLLKKEARDGA